MTSSVVDADTLLAIDLGSTYTRALLFDMVEGQYHFIAAGTAPSTVNAPFRDAGECVHQALEHLQSITGREIADKDASLIIPTRPDGSGVDRMVMTFSAGPELRVVTAGLLPDVSLESAKNLIQTTYGQVVEAIGLSDRRRADARLDAIIQANPDLVIIAGGTEAGASRSVLKLAELVAMACRVLPQNLRPQVLYAGNSSLAKKIKAGLEKFTKVHTAANVRPEIDMENLGAAEMMLTQVVTELRGQQIGGFAQLTQLCAATPLPSAHAFGRVIRFFSRLYDPSRGVLGVDIGAEYTALAAAQHGQLAVEVMSRGMGRSILSMDTEEDLREILRFVPFPLSVDDLRDYLHQKSLFAAAIPADEKSLGIEQAVARVILRTGMRTLRTRWSGRWMSFEPILATGGVLTRVADPAQSLLMLLDGLQPVGVTTLVIDPHGLAASLGAVAEINTMLPVQVMEKGAFQVLGTVICPASRAKPGTKIMNVRLEMESGEETRLQILQGSLVQLPLQNGQTARLHIDNLRSAELGAPGQRVPSSYKVVGGLCGAVIDARGRPLQIPEDESKRIELLKKWNSAIH